jgi:hypothetical protein
MTPREAVLIGLRDTLEHLVDCRKQLEWSEETQSQTFLTETMLRDLERCQRLLESLTRRTSVLKAV